MSQSNSESLVASFRSKEREVKALRVEAAVDKVNRMKGMRKTAHTAIRRVVALASKVADSTVYTEFQLDKLIKEVERVRPAFKRFDANWRGTPHIWIAARDVEFKNRYEKTWGELVEIAESIGENRLDIMFGDDRLTHYDGESWVEARPTSTGYSNNK